MEEDKPWGRLIEGSPGFSAARLAEALGITTRAFLKLGIQPIGVMKIPYQREFKVYDPTLKDTLKDHPEVIKARNRKNKAGGGLQAAETRRQICIEKLSQNRPELRELYSNLVEKLWNPTTEKLLLEEGSFYQRLAAMLWDALQPWEEWEDEAIDIIVDILWVVTKKHTWKVDNEAKVQHEPLVLDVWRCNVSPDEDPDAYKNVFLAAIRHLKYNDIPKWDGRRKAWEDLIAISQRSWPEDR